MRSPGALLLSAVLGHACAAIPQSPASEPCPPLPSAKQLAWHELEYYAFVHFNMDTFSGNEWGSGQEDPQLFAPSELDCGQWARVARDAGMKAIILTAKHHDGFCLWPSKYSTHTVAQSAWKGGRGDVLRELSDACRAYGLKLGLYLSPWDRNSKDYGNGASYNQYFANQLTEVLTQYGPVFEVWFDGACGEGPNGKQQVYDWKLFHDTVYRHQPNAVIFSDVGPDVRWMGNEQGIVGATNWAMLNTAGFEPGARAPKVEVLNTGEIDGAHWIPAECDVSIRPGWYYHAEQDGLVKSLERLQEIWFGSVGRGANLLLNLPVDRRGLVHENDVARLMEFERWRDETFRFDSARLAKPLPAPGQSNAELARLLDGDPRTFVAAAPGSKTLSVHFDVSQPCVSVIELEEPIEHGQRVARFSVRGARRGETPCVLARGTTIGRKRLLRIPSQLLNELWVDIEDARAEPLLATVALYEEPPRVVFDTDARAFLDTIEVALATDGPPRDIRYTLDGSEPNETSPLYAAPLRLASTTTIKAAVYWYIATHTPPSHGPTAQATFRRYARSDLRKAVQFIRAPDPGLRCSIYEDGWQTLDQLDGRKPTSQRLCDAPAVELATRHDHCALVFEGFVRVPADAIYTFELTSDDGSRLWIGEQLAVDHDGLHGAEPKRTEIGLEAGWHPLRVAWFNALGERVLALALRQSDGSAVPLVYGR